MLRITVHKDAVPMALRLEGKLAGDWVRELRDVWSCVQPVKREESVVVSLSGISGVDVAGRRLLREIYCTGGVLTGSGLYVRTLIEEITGKP